jgi:hypothetical protein
MATEFCLHAVKSYEMEPKALLTLRRNRSTDIIALKIPSVLARFEPANLGLYGKNDNHYTTENDGCKS